MLKIFLKFGKLSRSFLIFVCPLGEKFSARASHSCSRPTRPRTVGEYEYCLLVVKFLCLLRQQTGKAFCSQLTQVWRRSCGGAGGESVNSAGYLLSEQPIRAREKLCPPFQYILKEISFPKSLLGSQCLLIIAPEQPSQSSRALLSTLKVSIGNYSAQLIHTIQLTKRLPQVAPTRPSFFFFYLTVGTKLLRCGYAVYTVP